MGLVQAKMESSVETSPQLIESLHMAREVALKTDVAEVLPAHLLLAMLEDDESSFLLDAYGVDFKKTRMQLGKLVQKQVTPKSADRHAVFSPAIEQIMQHAREQAQKNALAEVDSNLILAVILSEKASFLRKILSPYDLDTSGVMQYLELREGKTVQIDPLPSLPIQPKGPATPPPPQSSQAPLADPATNVVNTPPAPTVVPSTATPPSGHPSPAPELTRTPPPVPPSTVQASLAPGARSQPPTKPPVEAENFAVHPQPTPPNQQTPPMPAGSASVPQGQAGAQMPTVFPPEIPSQKGSPPKPLMSPTPARPPANESNRVPSQQSPNEPGPEGLLNMQQARSTTGAPSHPPRTSGPVPPEETPSRLRSLFAGFGKKKKKEPNEAQAFQAPQTSLPPKDQTGEIKPPLDVASPRPDNPPQTSHMPRPATPQVTPVSQSTANLSITQLGLTPSAANNNQNPELGDREPMPRPAPASAQGTEANPPQTLRAASFADPAHARQGPGPGSAPSNPPPASVTQLVAPAKGTQTNSDGLPFPTRTTVPPGQQNRPAKRHRATPTSLGTNESLSATGSVLEKGRLVEAVPRKMKVNKPSRAEVRITREQLDEINREFDDLSTNHVHELAVTEAMTVQLRAPGNGFHIENLSPQTQWIDRNQRHINDADFGVWRWNVTPIKSGQSRLQLVISARTVDDEGNIHIADIPDKIIELAIGRDYGKTLKMAAFVGVLVLASLALGRYGEAAHQWISMLIAKYR